MAVIELDLEAPPAPPPTRPPIHLLRPVGLVLAVVLLLGLGGAAPITPMLWRGLGVIPLSAEDSRFELGGDRLYTMNGQVDGLREVSSWSLDPMRRDWTVTTKVPTTDGVSSRANLARSDRVLLLQNESFSTSVLDPGTGAVLWTTPGWIDPLGAGRALIQETHFRPGTGYDQSSGDAGELFWSSSGKPHIEPPLRTTLHSVDIRTGRRIWSAEQPGSVFTAPIGDGTSVLVVAADKLTVLDRDTGKVLRARSMQRREFDADVAWVEVIDDLLLLRRSASDDFGTIFVYATDTLEKRWEVEDAPDEVNEGNCVGLPCVQGEDGLTVLDPGTGRAAWHTARNVQLIKRGDVVLEMFPQSSRPMRVRDPATGVIRADVQKWDAPSPTSDVDQPLVLNRVDFTRQSSVFGVLPSGDTRVQPLGYAGGIMIECSSNDRFVACRVPGGIEVWAYRA